ncbi:MAG TPA: hypothetical protein VFI42_00735, partial [Thermomicrobiaceae bacterium]|nr:hypothetical protein [Thermomicrobiaceae bacterium]
DGAAIAKFLHWIDEEAPKGDVDELKASDHLEALRRQNAELRDLSFDNELTPPHTFGAYQPELPLVEAVNPLRSEWQLMRPTLLAATLRTLAENRKFTPSVGIFETARVYLPRGLDDLPEERATLAIGLAGASQREGLYSPARPVDFFDVKGIVEAYLQRVGALEIDFQPVQHASLHPGRAAALRVRGKQVGLVGEVNPVVAERFGLPGGDRAAVAEIDLVALIDTGLAPVEFHPVSRFMPVEQDYAVVVAEDTPASEVVKAIEAGAGALLVGVRLFDIYRGPAIPEGSKSLAFRVTLEAPDRQLEEREVERVRGRIEAQLKRRVKGALRA